jgi:hypothetical protein
MLRCYLFIIEKALFSRWPLAVLGGWTLVEVDNLRLGSSMKRALGVLDFVGREGTLNQEELSVRLRVEIVFP